MCKILKRILISNVSQKIIENKCKYFIFVLFIIKHTTGSLSVSLESLSEESSDELSDDE